MKKLIAAVISVCLLVGSASAISERSQCIKDARNKKTTAIRDANRQFRLERDACNGPCFSLCGTQYWACRQPVLATQETCLQTAENNFTIAFDACKSLVGCVTNAACARNAQFQSCLSPSRVVRSTAVQTCNRTANSALKGCENNLKDCNKACRRPAATPTPTPVP